jgi:hypothetical protein
LQPAERWCGRDGGWRVVAFAPNPPYVRSRVAEKVMSGQLP